MVNILSLEITTMMWMLLGASLLLGIFAYKSNQVKGKTVANLNKTFVVFGSAVLAIGLLYMGGFGALISPDFGAPFAAGVATATIGTDGQPIILPVISGDLCAVEDTSVTISGQNRYTVVATGGTHRYRISMDGGLNYAPAQTVLDKGTFTASPGNVIEILYNNENSTGAYGVLDVVVVPCKGTETFFTNTVNNGTLTTRVFNEENLLIDDDGVNETLAAGDVVNLDIEMQGQFQTEYPHGFVLVTEFNKTTIDEVIFILDGITLTETSIPTSFTPTLGADSSKQAFIVPAIISNNKLLGTITIDADDNNAPDEISSDVLFTYFANDYFVNTDEGGRIDGPSPEDEDKNAVRALQTFTLHID